ncbi:transporter substrate-binding domain-containing protein [Bradyrhizobium sp. 76]|uniref:transporter substrate-binding domain-containing protein n=1 Tax=Bradyrhizobium sp. 76 TaxID=2782680 RepID=UPI002097AED9|nr:transporter substrate-binding domain-containing protein [Bradyrhizobium sp. 76]MCK1406813.1 transporter substrate-binding domain-containing protein [Bradyrhizobium sp. 76]
MRFLTSKVPLLLLLLTFGGHSLPTLAQEKDSLLNWAHRVGQAKVALGSVPPWMIVSPSGEASGYAVEVMSLALKGMGVREITPVLTPWDAMIPGLLAHHFGLIGAGLVITEARCRVVVFSAPIIAMQDALYVVTGNPKHLTGFRQIAD